MTGKTDGTSTWTYTWDDDNRLTRVQGPGGVDVAYEYDSMGRMLTRDDGTAVTSFTWDGWNCVREDDGTNVFRYYCPQGELHAFEVNDDFYQVHCDALGSVRAITDSSGAVVGSYTYGAWGETLSASDPSGFTMPYKWVGSYGVRHDPTSGLYYMRNRWYDANLSVWLSPEPRKRLENQYVYASNRPNDRFDRNGLDSEPKPMPTDYYCYAIAVNLPNRIDFSEKVDPNPFVWVFIVEYRYYYTDKDSFYPQVNKCRKTRMRLTDATDLQIKYIKHSRDLPMALPPCPDHPYPNFFPPNVIERF